MQRGLNYPVVCIICKKEFLVKRYRQKSAKYCSQVCCGLSKIGIPAWNKGIEYLALKGNKNPNWVEDRSKLKRLDRRDNPLYRGWRKQVLQRDKYTCQICGFKGWPLHADHIQSFAKFPELRFELSNGRALCVPCHKKTDSWGNPKKTLETVR